MPSTPPGRPRSARPATALVTAVGAGLLVAAAPSTASAAPFKCDASAIRGSILGAPAIEPITANQGNAECADAKAGGAIAADLLSALPVQAGVLAAQTNVTPAGTANDKQAVLASGGIADLAVKALPTLPLTLPTAQIPAELTTLTVPLGSLTGLVPGLGGVVGNVGGGLGGLLGGGGGGGGSVTPSGDLVFDLKPAINALLPGGGLPNVDIVNIRAANAIAGADCKTGIAKPFGSSQVVGLKVLGQELPTNAALDQVLTLIDTSSVDLSTVDVTKIPLPAGLDAATAALLTPAVLSTILQPLVNALPPIAIPATLANVKITPSSQTLLPGDSGIIQQGPRLQVSILGQSIADVLIGEARVGTAGVDCTPPAHVAPTTATDLALQCTSRRLVLEDVLQQGSRVKLLGAADKKFAGQTVRAKLRATGKTVATSKVRSTGAFSMTAALPSKRIRNTDKARYQALIGSEKSKDLKLTRRMKVRSLTVKNGKVTIKGQVILPLANPRALIVLQRRVSCKTNETVKTFRPKSDGTFTVTADAPTGENAAVYRMKTRVRRTTRSKSTSQTFTLPRGVNLAR